MNRTDTMNKERSEKHFNSSKSYSHTGFTNKHASGYGKGKTVDIGSMLTVTSLQLSEPHAVPGEQPTATVTDKPEDVKTGTVATRRRQSVAECFTVIGKGKEHHDRQHQHNTLDERRKPQHSLRRASLPEHVLCRPGFVQSIGIFGKASINCTEGSLAGADDASMTSRACAPCTPYCEHGSPATQQPASTADLQCIHPQPQSRFPDSLASLPQDTFQSTTFQGGKTTQTQAFSRDSDMPQEQENDDVGPSLSYRLLRAVEMPSECRGHLFSSVAKLPDGNLAVADVCQETILVFSSAMLLLKTVPCPNIWRLSAVCSGHNNLVVIPENDGKLMLTNVSRDKSSFSSFKVVCSGMLRDVCSRRDRIYVLCSLGELHVFAMNGKQLRTVETPIPEMLNMTLTADGFGDLFYCRCKHSVICITGDGDEVWEYTDRPERQTDKQRPSRPSNKDNGHHVFSPQGIVLSEGRLYVSDTNSHRILELTLDGHFSRYVLTDNLQFPFSMCFLTAGEKLVVTQNSYVTSGKVNRVIKLFEKTSSSSPVENTP